MEERILNCKCSLELIFNIREELDKSNAFNKAYLLNLFNKKYKEIRNLETQENKILETHEENNSLI